MVPSIRFLDTLVGVGPDFDGRDRVAGATTDVRNRGRRRIDERRGECGLLVGRQGDVREYLAAIRPVTEDHAEADRPKVCFGNRIMVSIASSQRVPTNVHSWVAPLAQ